MILNKYLPPERVDVLLNMMIRFTQPKYLNDQYEALPLIQQFITKTGFESHIQTALEKNSNTIDVESILKEALPSLSDDEIKTIALHPSIKDLISNLYPLLVEVIKNEIVRSHADWMSEASKKFKEGVSNKLGILSLSEIYDSQTMWAHYAKNDTGYVIGFDSTSPFLNQPISINDEIRFIRPVYYTIERPIRPTIDEQTNENDFSAGIQKLLLTKNIDWEKEKEWRMIMPLNKATKFDNEIYLFNFPLNCVKEIIFGVNIEPIIKKQILDYLRNQDKNLSIKIYQALVSDCYNISLSEIFL